MPTIIKHHQFLYNSKIVYPNQSNEIQQTFKTIPGSNNHFHSTYRIILFVSCQFILVYSQRCIYIFSPHSNHCVLCLVSSNCSLFLFSFHHQAFCGFGKSHFYQFNSHPIFDLHFVDHPISSILTDEIICIWNLIVCVDIYNRGRFSSLDLWFMDQ